LRAKQLYLLPTLVSPAASPLHPGSLSGLSRRYQDISKSHSTNHMTKEQLKLAMALIASLDDEAKANAKVYGNWAEHLSDQIADDLTD
tara:strand:+ start:984 stop:1247 length:264 start_codon:yes stop_codon:yes gene_type:complete